MKSRAEHLDGLAKGCGLASRLEACFPHPRLRGGGGRMVDLSDHLEHLPTESIDALTATARFITRRITEIAGPLDARPLGALLAEVSVDFVDKLEQAVSQLRAAGDLAVGAPGFIHENAAQPSVGFGIGVGEKFGDARHDRGEALDRDVDVGARNHAAQSTPTLVHRFGPVLAAAGIGAAIAWMIQARRTS